jgi:(p)ppGpp synthase/HD superfamily hydrolase
MVERVRLESGLLLAGTDAARITAAVAAALVHREPHMPHDHDPRYLHPARSVLILIADASCRSADALAAAAGTDSVDAALAPDTDVLRAVGGARVAALRAAVPLPAALPEAEHGALLEALVTADDDVALIALAERLDQARHLQFRTELDWHLFHAGVEAAYIPAAQRFSPPLARRFERWAEAFRRRLLPRP